MATAGIPLAIFFWNRINQAKEEGVKQAALAIIPIQETANEAKKLSIEALSRLNQFELRVAKEYVSQQHFEKFEDRLFREIETIKDKLDDKADKA